MDFSQYFSWLKQSGTMHFATAYDISERPSDHTNLQKTVEKEMYPLILGERKDFDSFYDRILHTFPYLSTRVIHRIA